MILFLHQFDLDLAGGSGTYLRLLVRAFTAGGRTVEVVAARRPDRYGCTSYELPFKFTLTFGPQRRPGERTFDDFSMAELHTLAADAAEAVEEQVLAGGTRPELLLVNHISLPADVARRLSERWRVPYRLISYGTDTQLLLEGPRYVEWLRPAVERAERIFAISGFVANQLQGCFAGTDVRVLGGAVDTTVFRPVAADGRADRLAYVGRLVTEKGLWTLLEALDRLDPRLALDVVGEGPLSEPLREAALRRPNGRLNLLGYLPPEGVQEVLGRSVALVVPSLWQEPLGLVVLEAIACGVPVIATEVGGIPEIVEHGRTGLLVEPNDPEALARTIALLVSDLSLRQRLRDHCLTKTTIPTPSDLAAKVLA
jgi:glycosyltransferase involved in cell wall biosynthesis